MPGCLREDELERYLAQELTATQVAEVEAHLKACRHCADRNEALACDEEGLLDRLRRLGVKRIEDLASASLAAEPATPTDGESPVESGDPGSSSPAAVTIEGYETLEELHRGGQGVVYRAIQKHTNRAVAVKVLLEGPYASPAAKRRFEREIELAAQLKHTEHRHDLPFRSHARPAAILRHGLRAWPAAGRACARQGAGPGRSAGSFRDDLRRRDVRPSARDHSS